MNKLICECGLCKREHDFFDEYDALMKIVRGINEPRAVVLLKDCDNGEYPFLLIAETSNLKMGISLPRSADVMFVFGEFQPLSKTIRN